MGGARDCRKKNDLPWQLFLALWRYKRYARYRCYNWALQALQVLQLGAT